MSELKIPYSEECEQSVIATVLNYSDAIHFVADILKPDDFYHAKHNKIFEACLKLERPDLVSVIQKLKESQSDVSAYDVSSMSKLSVPSLASLEYNARVVAEKSMLRKMALLGSELNYMATDFNADPFGIAAELMSKVDVITGVIDQRQEITAADALSRIKIGNNDQKPINTNYPTLDDELHGWVPGNVYILAARPGMGKTTIALNLAAHFAENVSVAFMSLEMPYSQIVHRLAQYYLRRNIPGDLSNIDADTRISLSNISDMGRIVIDDTAAMDVRQMRAKITRYVRKHNIKVVVVDYIQLVSPQDRHVPREQQVSDVSRTLKHIAKDLNVVVVALSQLNRDVEKRPDKRPLLSDLRESGSIEQDADVVLMLYWGAYYSRDEDRSAFDKVNDNTYEVIIRKNRHGRSTTVVMDYAPALTRITERLP